MADIEQIYSILLGQGFAERLFFDLQDVHKEGRNMRARCPFCSSPRGFSYSLDKALWRCFACGEQGDWLGWLQKQRGLEFLDALQELAHEAHVELTGYTRKDKEAWLAKEKKADILEQAALFFQETLLEGAGLPELEYLLGRGYSKEQIEEMELGAYTSRDALVSHLSKYGYSQDDIQKAGLFTGGLGDTHTVSLLWRETSGKAIGLACRTIQQGLEPKYIYSYGLQKSKGLVGLEACRGKERIVLVEGPLDALLLSKFYKIPAVAVGGTSISTEQARALEWAGAKELFLAFDMDRPGREATAKAIRYLRRSTAFRLYVVSLPDGYKDADELLRAKGVEAFQRALDDAERWPTWLAKYIVSGQDISTTTGMDEAMAKAMDALELLGEGLEARLFSQALMEATGLSGEEIDIRLQKRLEGLRKQKRVEILKNLADNLQQKASEGDMLEAEQALADALKELRDSRGFRAPEPYLLDDLEADILRSRPGLKTGFQKLDELLTLPRGAISIVAGRPGHGKTSFLLNLLSSFLDRYPDKAFYYFSYEEALKFLALKMVMLKGGQVLSERFNQEAHLNYLQEKRGENEHIERALEWYGKAASQGRLILDDKMPDIDSLVLTLEHVCRSHEVGAVIVDYIQKIPVSRPASQRYLDIKAISQSLLQVAVSQDIPIILGAQLGRGAKGEGKEPSLADLREAGDIEQDASLVLSLYNASVAELEEGQRVASRKVDIQVRILKQRGGLAGQKATLTFDRPILRMMDKSPMAY